MMHNVNNNQVYRLSSSSSPLCSKPRRKFVHRYTRGPHNFTEIILYIRNISNNTPDRLPRVFFKLYSKLIFGPAPNPAGGAYDAPPDFLVGFSTPRRLRRLDSRRLRLLGISKFGQGPHFSECTRASKVLIWH